MTSLPRTDEEKSFYKNMMNDSKYNTSSLVINNSFDINMYDYINKDTTSKFH